MVHQINTPKKYSIIHANGGGGLFASYNRSIPKNGVPQTNKIKINDFYDQNKSAINKPANKIQKYIDGNKKCKSKIKSIRENSNSQDDNYQDEYSQIIRNEMKEKVLIRANLKKDNEISETAPTEIKKENTDFRVRSASSNKKYRYNKDENTSWSPANRISSGK